MLPEELKAHVGAFLLLTPQGEMVLDTQYYSEQQILIDEPADDDQGGDGEDGERSSGCFRIGGPKPSEPTYRRETVAPGGKPLSSRLYDELAMQRGDILASCILAQPALALDYALFYGGYPVDVTANRLFPREKPSP